MASRAHAVGTTRRVVRRMFEPTRIAEDCLADAYARLVPVIGRHVPVDLHQRAGDDKTSAARTERERQEGRP